MTSFSIRGIEWRLRVIMAERDIRVGDLAEKTGLARVTISRLKNTKVMPNRLHDSTLGLLCAVLDCQPGDLMRLAPDSEKS